MLWKWVVIIALSMTPNLILGQSIAALLGIRWGLDPWALIPVMTVFGYIEGVGVALLVAAGAAAGAGAFFSAQAANVMTASKRRRRMGTSGRGCE